ncbi:hypothetical protein PV325_010367 [Microctonus aethiopoides]|nr:hypothetical protein PV325_010367 [Microctonus aethiopoides]
MDLGALLRILSNNSRSWITLSKNYKSPYNVILLSIILKDAILQRITVATAQLQIKASATCLYLCMDSCGLLYGSATLQQYSGTLPKNRVGIFLIKTIDDSVVFNLNYNNSTARVMQTIRELDKQQHDDTNEQA